MRSISVGGNRCDFTYTLIYDQCFEKKGGYMCMCMYM